MSDPWADIRFSVSRFSGVRRRVVGKTGQKVHAGLQSQGDPAVLLKGHVAPPGLDFRIVALVDAGEHLHLDLGISLFPPELFHRCHTITPGKLCPVDLLKIG